MFIGHAADVTGLSVAEESGGRLFCTCSTDGSLRAWDARTGACVRLFDLPAPADSCDISASGESVAVGLLGQNVTWDGGAAIERDRAGIRWKVFDLSSYRARAASVPGRGTTFALGSCSCVAFANQGR